MKRLFYYILIPLLSCSCSASYWSAASFGGDAMYDTYTPAPVQRRYVQPQEQITTQHYYTPYQRPESYYQYQYASNDTLAVSSSAEEVTIEPKYVSSTYGTWDETPVIETYVYVESTPYIYYDPFYYGRWGYVNPYHRPYWGYPYYGWYAPIYVAPRPHRPSVSRPRPNIVQRPSSSVAPSTSSGSTRGKSSTPTRVTRSSVSSSSSSRTSTTPTSTRTSTPSSSTTTTTNSSSSYR